MASATTATPLLRRTALCDTVTKVMKAGAALGHYSGMYGVQRISRTKEFLCRLALAVLLSRVARGEGFLHAKTKGGSILGCS
jgi:hypothetical protein